MGGDWSSDQPRKLWTLPNADMAYEHYAKRSTMSDLVHLLLVEEAGRLTFASLPHRFLSLIGPKTERLPAGRLV